MGKWSQVELKQFASLLGVRLEKAAFLDELGFDLPMMVKRKMKKEVGTMNRSKEVNELVTKVLALLEPDETKEQKVSVQGRIDGQTFARRLSTSVATAREQSIKARPAKTDGANPVAQAVNRLYSGQTVKELNAMEGLTLVEQKAVSDILAAYKAKTGWLADSLPNRTFDY